MYWLPNLWEQLATLKIYYQVFLSNPYMSFLANVHKNPVKVRVRPEHSPWSDYPPLSMKKCLGNSGLGLDPLYQNT